MLSDEPEYFNVICYAKLVANGGELVTLSCSIGSLAISYRAQTPMSGLRKLFLTSNSPSNKSLDASRGSVFDKIKDAAMLE